MTSKILLDKSIILKHLPQRLNITQIEYMAKRLAPFIGQHRTEIILDLREVLFMDCRMVGYLVSTNRELKSRDSKLTLRNLTNHVKLLVNVLKISNIINIEEIYE